MIQPLKDMDGNYIPLDTIELYDDDGTAVGLAGFFYVSRVGVWSASTVDGKTLFPNLYHLNNPTEEKDIDELLKALAEIVENDKFRNLLKNHFAELKERCE
jgi:hypothetical protein